MMSVEPVRPIRVLRPGETAGPGGDCLPPDPAELQAALRRLERRAGRLVAAHEHERAQVARELHDQVGQALTAMVIHLSAADRAPDPGQAADHRRIATGLATAALADLRRLGFSLRRPQLDLLGTTAAVRSVVACLADPAGIAFTLTSRGVEPAAPGANAGLAVRLVQDALAGIVREGRASLVEVRLRFLAGGRIDVVVADDGAGVDPAGSIAVRGNRADGEAALDARFGGALARTELAGGTVRQRTFAHGSVLRARI